MRGAKQRSTDRWAHHDDANFDDGSCNEYMDTPDRSQRHDDMPYSDASASSLSADALHAHRQVLEMAATIEILTRDFETQQQELLRAYKQLNEYASKQSIEEPVDRDSSAAPKLFGPRTSPRCDDDTSTENSDGACSGQCSHWSELQELRKLVDVKDTALTEALQQRNEYRVELEHAEAHIRDLRSMHLDANSGSCGAWKVHPTASNMSGYHATGVAMPCTHASLMPGFASSGSASMLQSSSTGGAIDVPRHERFDHESTYQRRENDELFWRKQYKEAVRMRKKYGLVNSTTTAAMTSTSGHLHRSSSHSSHNTSSSTGATRPSLKIFSYPDNRRQKGITDENVPFSRYIGISARQHEIIKEHHRMLA